MRTFLKMNNSVMKYMPIGLIILLAFSLRVWNLDFGMPYSESRPDELTIIGKALSYGSGDFNPHFFNYPSAFSYLLFGFYGLYSLILLLFGFISSLDEVPLYFVKHPLPFFVIARSVSVVMGTAAVPFVYLIAKGFAGRLGGLLAALLMAVNYLHVRDSHFGVTDISMTTLVCAAVWFAFRVHENGRMRDCIWAGLLVGLAASFKYNGALSCIPLAVGYAVYLRNNKSLNFKHYVKRMSIAGACAVGAFLMTSPYVLLDWRTFLNDFLYESHHLAGKGETEYLRGWLYHIVVSLRYGSGIPAVGLALIGSLLIFKKAPWHKGLILLSFPLVYYVLIGNGYTVFVRYILPVVPFVCILAACGAVLLSRYLVSPKHQALAAAMLGVVAFVPSLVRAVQFDVVIGKQDTRELLVRYLENNLPSGSEAGWVGTRYGKPVVLGKGEGTGRRKYPNTQVPKDPKGMGRGKYPNTQGPKGEGVGGRLVRARMELARTAGVYCLDFVDISADDLRRESDLPEVVVTEFYPLAYSRQALGGAEEVLRDKGYLPVKQFSGASRDILEQRKIVFDFQDSFYVPFSHPGAVARPGPTLTVWRRVDPLSAERPYYALRATKGKQVAGGGSRKMLRITR